MKKYATSFKLTKETIKMMDQLVEHPPPMLVDGINGKARNRTEVIEILVRYAHSMIAKEGDEKATSESAKSKDSSSAAHSESTAT